MKNRQKRTFSIPRLDAMGLSLIMILTGVINIIREQELNLTLNITLKRFLFLFCEQFQGLTSGRSRALAVRTMPRMRTPLSENSTKTKAKTKTTSPSVESFVIKLLTQVTYELI